MTVINKSLCVCCKQVESEFVCDVCFNKSKTTSMPREESLCIKCKSQTVEPAISKICDECFDDLWDKQLNREIERFCNPVKWYMYFVYSFDKLGQGFGCHIEATSEEEASNKYLTDFPEHKVSSVYLLGKTR
ncbi:hypothetical protein ACFSCX_06365 [Bacillus salitolerans]|uniref:Uncharacterized protein n=1 Tax=Bacillus salitolerans TaxID=1437434 RepID=A0ABW4LM68_9BACI